MLLIRQFILYNLSPALLSGLLTWMAISVGIALLRIEYSPLRLSLLYAPVVKASLVMLGIGLAFPWPREFFVTWHAQALLPTRVIPFFLIWGGIVFSLRTMATRRARQLALQSSMPASHNMACLADALDRVMARYQTTNFCVAGSSWANCCLEHSLPHPRLVLSNQIISPYIVSEDAKPVLVFPAGLVDYLTADELDAALAHEMAHLTLKQPIWCSSASVQKLAGITPLAGLLAAQLHQEEEKACDDMASIVLGKPEVLASMLLKAYRFAHQRTPALVASARNIQPLLGLRPVFSERIERLTRSSNLYRQLWSQQCAACILWIGVILLF